MLWELFAVREDFPFYGQSYTILAILKVLTPKQSDKVWSGFSVSCSAYILNNPTAGSACIFVVSVPFEQYSPQNQVRLFLLDYRRNAGSHTTLKALPTPATSGGAHDGVHGRHRQFWDARGECRQPPIYFDMDNCLPSHVAKWNCVGMPHDHCWLENTIESMFWQLLYRFGSLWLEK